MIKEILILALIIIVLSIFLLFFKSWHIHIKFKNYNFEYFFSLDIIFLLIDLNIEKDNLNSDITINLKIRNKLIKIFNIKSESNNEDESVDDESVEDNTDKDDDNKFNKIRKISVYVLDSKEEIYKIILLLKSMITFKGSNVTLNLGLEDNNLTIKICNFLWALAAPLYPLNFQFILTPEINQAVINSKMQINFDMKLLNIIKIAIIFIRNEKLMKIVKEIR